MESSDKEQGNKKIPEVQIFPVPFALGEKQENLTVNTNTLSNPSTPSKEQIINQAFKFHSQGNISEAKKYYQYFINQGFKDHRVFSNYGVILQYLGKLKDAEISTRKAIELNPNFANSYYNLGNILRGLGKLKDAEISTRKAIQLNPFLAIAHSNLGNILKDLGNLDEALLSYQEAVNLDKKLDYAIAGIGKILLQMGNHADGIRQLREANGSIELNPKKSSITIN